MVTVDHIQEPISVCKGYQGDLQGARGQLGTQEEEELEGLQDWWGPREGLLLSGLLLDDPTIVNHLLLVGSTHQWGKQRQ